MQRKLLTAFGILFLQAIAQDAATPEQYAGIVAALESEGIDASGVPEGLTLEQLLQVATSLREDAAAAEVEAAAEEATADVEDAIEEANQAIEDALAEIEEDLGIDLDEIEEGAEEGEEAEEGGDDEDVVSEESEESEPECEDEVYACQAPDFFEDETACADGCEDWSDTARTLWQNFQDLSEIGPVEAEISEDLQWEGVWEYQFNSGDGQQINATIDVNITKYAAFQSEKSIESEANGTYVIVVDESAVMSNDIDVLISDQKIWNDAIVVAWVCEDSVCDAWWVSKDFVQFMVVPEEEDMLAAIRVAAYSDADAEDGAILSYQFDEDELVVSATCQEYQADLPCVIDEHDFDYENGVTARVVKYHDQATVLPADVEIVHGEIQEPESEDEDDVAEDLEDLADELEEALDDLEEELEDAVEDALEDLEDAVDDGETTEPSDEARRLQDEEPAEEVTTQEGEEDVAEEGEGDVAEEGTEDVAEEGTEEAEEAQEAWAPGARRVGMAVMNVSTLNDQEEYGQLDQQEIILEGEGSIYTELESSVEAAVEEAKEAKKAAEEEAEGGQVDEDEDEDEDDGSISLASTFGALAIAAAALAF